jgi:hypothetical protein
MIRFPLGRVVATPGALGALEKAEQLPAVEQGLRILSAYTTSAGDKIWILTEADRSATILMLPEDY